MKKQINPTIKAHLIRGAFYLLLLLVACAIPFALGQRNTTKRSAARSSAVASMKMPLVPGMPLSRMRLPNDVRAGMSADAARPGLAAKGVLPSTATPGGCQFQVLIVYADSEGLPTQLQSEILAEPGVTACDLFDATVGTPTLLSSSNTTLWCHSVILRSWTAIRLATTSRTTWMEAG